ncbi:phage tail protein [Escherichia coli]|uniref:phage tail protein n=1 Tax=Escherichia coli TaxID=562 RepID=UPI001EDDB90F|nr:phage tail protein [Escherichia coli]UKO79123.1 tail fiber protein [Escherichia coli]
MGADKTNNIMTLSSGVSQPLLADVQYFELYSSSALNRKLKNIVLPGFYCGFEPVPGTGLSVRITSENSEGKGAASVDVNNVQISVQQIEDVTVSVKAGATNIIVLEANFEHGVKTTQVDSASSVSAARIYARTDNTIGQNQIELCRVIVPRGATAVTKEMIVLKYRVNRAVGVEFSNEISSTEERKAATPLAVKTLHDLVDTKAPLDSPHLSGTPTSPTPAPGTNNTQIANAAFVYAAINALINGAPGTMDTLKEIAAAINNDPNFSTTINNALAGKQPLDNTLTNLSGKDVAGLLTYLGLGEGSALPVGVPVPWPSATPPTGWLKCNGAAFSAEEYPELAKAYPTNKLPDLRGEFIRGWDDERGVDSGRTLLSAQGDAIRNITGSFGQQRVNSAINAIVDVSAVRGAFYGDNTVRNNINVSMTYATDRRIRQDVYFSAANVVPTANENRPRNIAFNYIVRAA